MQYCNKRYIEPMCLNIAVSSISMILHSIFVYDITGLMIPCHYTVFLKVSYGVVFSVLSLTFKN